MPVSRLDLPASRRPERRRQPSLRSLVPGSSLRRSWGPGIWSLADGVLRASCGTGWLWCRARSASPVRRGARRRLIEVDHRRRWPTIGGGGRGRGRRRPVGGPRCVPRGGWQLGGVLSRTARRSGTGYRGDHRRRQCRQHGRGCRRGRHRRHGGDRRQGDNRCGDSRCGDSRCGQYWPGDLAGRPRVGAGVRGDNQHRDRAPGQGEAPHGREPSGPGLSVSGPVPRGLAGLGAGF